VPVPIEGDGDRKVPEHLLDLLRVGTDRDGQGGRSVTPGDEMVEEADPRMAER
jgi:hypothetical protein